MDLLRYECRDCGKVTKQLVRIVTNNLPDNVKVLQCVVCSNDAVCQLDMVTSYADIDGCD